MMDTEAQSGLNNRHQGGYQSGAGSYQPPRVAGDYAEQQTGVVEDTMRTHYQTEGTAATVLSQMTTQRNQLEGAHNDVHNMKETTEKAKNELINLIAKVRAKKRKLQLIVAALSAIDLFLFFRIAVCGGSFFCRRY
eukprot:CAMPEP_0197836492 /NCGR_PEP_ID=MMETSP1437-20131217/29168_1 /TAXON_ID=49252 ORGANISM="Eucampia antarctica, Strain CCMP1452" /NCGR_SAMPLE_ID=MMETSP1437 /ASSEMBLY_ACC=CAM_ASM_001096 /LENGTH=135 /DNA_ID=CAMNT_0043442707 /DNA_START=185 /DNA_END=592 /DNA_ORIENTATION=+